MASTAPAVGQDERAQTKTGLLASVIVPVRNRPDYLRELLDALAAQTIPREGFEVIIGDDGSTDGSTDELATGDGWIQVLTGPPMNSYAARNRAARAARSPVLAFCDSDCKPEPDWLEKGLAALDDADAVAGGIRFVLPRRRTLWTLLDIEMTKDHERQVPMGNAETANLFVRRDLFTELDGFDDALPGHGDFDFASRFVASGGRLVYAPEALVWHPARERALPFLGMVWDMNRCYAAREARAGRLPVALKLRCWIPALSVIRSRRRMGFSLGLDRRTLNANGVRPRLRDDIRALPAIYLLLPYLRGFAQLRGCIDGRRMR